MTVPTLDALTKTIDALYQAAYADEAWPAALENLQHLLRSHAVGYILQDLDTHAASAVCLGSDPAYHAIYSHYAADNAYVAAFPLIADGTAFTEEALLPKVEFRKTRFYNEWMVPQDGHTTLCGKIQTFGSVVNALAFCRSDRQPAFDQSDLAVMDLLFPTLQRVAAIQQALGEERLKLWMSRRALDALAFGVLAVDADCRVLFANDAAEELLQMPSSGLAAPRRILTIERPALKQLLRDRVAAACSDQAGLSGLGGSLSWLITNGQGPQARVVLSISPLDKPESFGLAARPGAIVFVKQTGLSVGGDPASELAPLFGLTPAEARVAAALTAGLSLQETAEQQGTGITTVRTHLSRIFQKTGTQRQAELIASLQDATLPLRRA